MTVEKDAATNARKTTGFHPPGVKQAGRVLALLLFAGVAIAQNPQATAVHAAATEAPARPAESAVQTAPAPRALEKRPVPTKISYVSGQLRINAFGATLGDVLTKVATLTGVVIDVPAGANNERMPVVELGPGTARQVLASLLSDSTFDYLIQSSSADPEKLQSVLLIPREKKGGGTGGAEVTARPSRSAYARAEAQPEAPVPDIPVPAQREIAAPETSSLNSVAAAMPADPSAPPTSGLPDQPMLLQPAQPDISGVTRPGALTPPQTLNPQSINQQLQQMYQQRMQMIQPGGQTVQPAVR